MHELRCSLVCGGDTQPFVNDTCQPGGQESDYGDTLRELQATWSPVVGQSCWSSLLMSCFCKRYTWELGLSTFISVVMASILGWQMCSCHLMRDWDSMSKCRHSQKDSDLWPCCISLRLVCSLSSKTQSHMLCHLFLDDMEKRTQNWRITLWIDPDYFPKITKKCLLAFR